jgi:transposase
MARPAKYPEQCRRDAVELVEASGRSIEEVSRALSINEGTLWNWVHDARAKQARDGDPEASTESEWAEV